MVKFKANVRIFRLTPSLHWILNCLYEIGRDPKNGQPLDLIVTSINDGLHSGNSRHYVDEAVDIRSKNFFSKEAKLWFKDMLQGMLNSHPDFPDCFTVLYEYPGEDREHFHVQPKKGTKFPPAEV